MCKMAINYAMGGRSRDALGSKSIMLPGNVEMMIDELMRDRKDKKLRNYLDAK